MADRRFDGRVAVVAGGASGIGSACVERLAREGAIVVVLDQQQATADSVARSYVIDVRDERAVIDCVSEVERVVGPIRHLAITSGIFVSEPMLDSGLDTWRTLFDVNVFGAVTLLRAAGSRMRARGDGSVVVVASQSACVVRVRQAAYGASKAALTYATKALGLELAPHGVRVNVVQPGTTDTPLARKLWDAGKGSPEAHVKGSLENFRAPIPLGSVARPDDVAAAVLFLLGDEARQITMTELVVDGGSSYVA